ncbi:MAG: DUF11 domain-containing protein, partial [Gammaproteobacteria bacterium]|nr:DUF11 domain-containing protein [Gammaproteobacteria bacterium]
TQTEGTDPTTITAVAGTNTDAGTDGYYQSGTVSGHLYIDTNGNSTQDVGEPDLENVDVIITDTLGITQTVTTDANGDWTATVPPGSTTADVDETDAQYPTGYTQTEGTDPTTVTAVAGTDTNAGTDGYYQSGTVSGHLYIDTNGNSTQDVGEPDLENVDVIITDTLGITQTVTTDASGDWTATVPSGSTTADIDETDPDYPTGYIQTEGTDPTTVTAVAGTDTSAGIDGYTLANPDITMVKSVSVASTVPNQTAVLTYTLSVTNTGNVRLTNVTVTDTLPVGLTYVPSSASPSETIHAGQDLRWDDITSGADFNPGDNLQIVFETTLTNTIGTYINEAGVIATVPSGNNYPGGTVDDIDDIPVIVADPSVALDKEMVAPGIVDGVITYTIRITNTGPSMLDVLPLFDTFTGPMEYIGGTPAAVDNGGGSLVWNDLTTSFGDLAPGQVITVETVFQITSIDTDVTIINSAQILGGVDLFTNLTNEPDDTVTLINIPTAVELTSFTVDHMEDMQVRVEWVTVSEIDNFGFRVYRNQTNVFAEATEVHFEPSAVPGGTGFGASYQYVDTIPAYGTYYYWLEDVETGGVTAVHGSVPLSDPVSLTVNQLYQLFMPFIINP